MTIKKLKPFPPEPLRVLFIFLTMTLTTAVAVKACDDDTSAIMHFWAGDDVDDGLRSLRGSSTSVILVGNPRAIVGLFLFHFQPFSMILPFYPFPNT